MCHPRIRGNKGLSVTLFSASCSKSSMKKLAIAWPVCRSVVELPVETEKYGVRTWRTSLEIF
jgi:hypothetical protein